MEYAKAQEIRDRIAVGVCSRIRRDRERASADMRRLLDELEAHLFDVEFDVSTAYEVLDRSEEDARREFHLLTGTAPKYYLRDLRIQVAQRLLETPPLLSITMISELAGYGSLKSIGRAFHDRFGMSPSAYRRQYAAAAVHFPPDLPQKLEEGRLEEGEARVLMTYLRSHHPEAVEDFLGTRFISKDEISVEELEQLLAERLWSQLEKMPERLHQEQVKLATFFSFTTPALFELLTRKSFEVGREDRAQGKHISRLALISALTLEHPCFKTGKSLIWAQAWATVGNNRRLALDLDGAEAAFHEAEHFLPEESPSAVLGDILNQKALLRWYQRKFDDGITLADKAISLLRTTDDIETLAKAQIIHALLCDYNGHPQISIEGLTYVLQELLPHVDNADITMAAYYNLARCYRKLERYDKVKNIIRQLKEFSKKLEIRMYTIYIDWLEGRLALDMHDFKAAENHLISARSGFLLIGSELHAGLTGIDLAIAYHEQDRQAEALETAQEVMSALESCRDQPNISTAWRRLRRTVITGTISLADLIMVREITDAFQEDPANQRYFDFSVAAV